MKHSGANLPALSSLDAGAHFPQGLHDPRHGAADEGIVTGEHRENPLPRKKPGKQPRGGPRVLRVQGPCAVQ